MIGVRTTPSTWQCIVTMAAPPATIHQPAWRECHARHAAARAAGGGAGSGGKAVGGGAPPPARTPSPPGGGPPPPPAGGGATELDSAMRFGSKMRVVSSTAPAEPAISRAAINPAIEPPIA